MQFIDLTGKKKKCGRWRVLKYLGKGKWKCRCKCGTVKVISGKSLREKKSKSCGCRVAKISKYVNYKHGKSRTPEYFSWRMMHARCYSSTNNAYKYYGGKGITVCKRWHKFENFLEDMGKRPKGMTLERRKNGVMYRPGNCYWANRQEQTLNRCTTIWITLHGITLCLKDWCKRAKLDYGTVRKRLRNGWTTAKALTTRPQTKYTLKEK